MTVFHLIVNQEDLRANAVEIVKRKNNWNIFLLLLCEIYPGNGRADDRSDQVDPEFSYDALDEA